MDKHTWDRRLLLRRGAAAGVGAAGLIATGRALVAAQATPEPAAGPAGCDPLALLPKVPAFRVTSSDVADGVQLPTPQLSGIAGVPGGQDQSPQLAWDGFPAATQSFTVTMYDADAPTGSGFWHWVVVDIPAGTTSLPAGAGAAGDAGLPTGAFHLPNDLRLAQYLGAAPPPGSGPHRYYIVVTAIDVPTLGVPKDATPAFLGFNVAGHALARAVIVPIAETVAAPATPSPSA
ncbi:MAG TPA: YbhB/YbcL family Raf kinase inhibitor-like protein [Thermomicrobiales bacterium]